MHDEPRKHRMKKIASLADAVRFHGHTCPGLMPGYRAAEAAARELVTERDADETRRHRGERCVRIRRCPWLVTMARRSGKRTEEKTIHA